MKRTWPVNVVLTMIVLGVGYRIYNSLLLVKYIKYVSSRGGEQIIFNWIATLFATLFAIWFFQKLKNGSNGFRIFYIVIASLGVPGSILILYSAVHYQGWTSPIFFTGIFYLLMNLFILWAFILHKPTVQFFKPQLSPPYAPSAEPIQNISPQPEFSAASGETASDATDCDQELINRLKKKLQS